MSSAERLRVYCALVLVQVFFGINYLLAKVVLEEMTPRTLAVLRVVGGAVILLLYCRLSGRRFPLQPKVLGQLAVYAIFGVILNQLLFIEGLYRTTPTHSSLINTSIPLLTLAMATLAGRERWTLIRGLSLAVGFVGVALVVVPQPAGPASATLIGDLLTLTNATSFSLFLVMSKGLLTRTDPVGATAVLMTFGAVGIGAVGLPDLLATDLGSVSTAAWVMIAYIAVFPTALAYLFQYWALVRVDSSEVALFIYLQPLIAASLSVLFLGERLSWILVLGGSMIFAAVYLRWATERAQRAG